jgi:outer membrane protein TolC
MSEVTLSDTSIAILALNQAKQNIEEKRHEVYRQVADYTNLIETLDEQIQILIEHNHNCLCWRVQR